MKSESVKNYLICYLSLMTLLFLTAIISQVDLGAWSIPVAMGIASIKGVLILMIFMHAGEGRNYFYLITGLLFFLAAVMILTLADFNSRIGE